MVASPRIDPIVLEWLHESVDGARERLEDPRLRSTVASVTLASRALGRVLITDVKGLDILDDLDNCTPNDGDPEELPTWCRRELLRIAARDLTGIDDVAVVADNLAKLADEVLRTSLTAGSTDELAIIGMGKLGGFELNYASDIDILLVGHATPQAARKVLETARKCFRVDTNLRPEGVNGSLVRSLASYEAYWERWASPWEFQALLKARAIAGPLQLQADWSDAAEKALWQRPFGAEEIRNVREMKARSEQIVANKGLSAHEVKRGRGGIRDVEFAVQLLQLVHGRRDATIRSKATLTALAQLDAGGYIAGEDANALAESYKFLRVVEHRLQLVELEQTHTIPKDTANRGSLAANLGLDLETFDRKLAQHQTTVRHSHERLYFRPLLESFSNHDTLGEVQLEERVVALGFSDADRTRLAIKELTRGLARSSSLMQQMMPLILDWLSASPDPDEGLLGLRTLMSGFRTPSGIVAAFRDSPEVARRMCTLLGTSRTFARAIVRNPELLDDMNRAAPLSSEWSSLLDETLDWRSDPQERQTGLARFNQVQRTRIAMFDTLNLITDSEASTARSGLADAILNAALENLQPSVPVALIAMGRYGGYELGPGSDLDVVVIHGGTGPKDQREAENIAQRLLRNVSHPSPAYRLYELDYDLRPEGKQGVLARSVASCADYYARWADTWEKQALVRARHLAGDIKVAMSFFNAVDEFAWKKPLSADETREVRRLKARMETERIPQGEDPQFHLKLGPGTLSDVEWTVQQLQLQHLVTGTSTLPALNALVERGHVSLEDAAVLQSSWEFCQRVRNRQALIASGPADSMPVDRKQLNVLARSLNVTSGELREEYLRRTRLCRAVSNRLFYGAEQ